MQSPQLISRAAFLKTSALAFGIPFLAQENATAKTLKTVGLQLYTLRDDMGKDPEGTLKKVAAIGYKEVETFGFGEGKFFGQTPKDFKTFLDSLGLKTPSGHYMPTQLKKDWNATVDSAAEAGQQFMMCAYLFPNERKTLDDYKKFAELFNQAKLLVVAKCRVFISFL